MSYVCHTIKARLKGEVVGVGGLKGLSVLHQEWQDHKKCQNRRKNKPIFIQLKLAIKNTFMFMRLKLLVNSHTHV